MLLSPLQGCGRIRNTSHGRGAWWCSPTHLDIIHSDRCCQTQKLWGTLKALFSRKKSLFGKYFRFLIFAGLVNCPAKNAGIYTSTGLKITVLQKTNGIICLFWSLGLLMSCGKALG